MYRWLRVPALLCACLFAAEALRASDFYGAARGDYLKAGEAYASGDDSAFVSRLENMIRKYEATAWGHEARLALSLYYSQMPQHRDAARKMLRQVVLDARDLPFSRAAQFLLAKMAEEEGAFAQAAKEYRILSGMAALVEELERVDRYRSSMIRLPSYSLDTDYANLLRSQATERLLYIDFLQPGTGRPFPATVKTVACGEMLALDLPKTEENRGSASFIIYVPGEGASSFQFEVGLRNVTASGTFRVEATPLHPLGVGFHLPRISLLPTSKDNSGALFIFEKAYRVYEFSLSWRDASPRVLRLAPLETAVEPTTLRSASLWRGLFRSGSSPFGRGIASLRLRYDPARKRFLMLIAAPESGGLNPLTPANLYTLSSADGLNWEPPERVNVSGFRDDFWPDYVPSEEPRLVWISSRRGPGLYDLCVAKGGGPPNFEKMQCITFEPEQLVGMPGWVQVRVRCATALYADGHWQLFFLARGVGRGAVRGSELKLKAGSLYHLRLGAEIPRRIPPVLSATTGDLDRYLGRREAGREAAFISEKAGICALVDTMGRPSIIWLSDSGVPCVTFRRQPDTWQTARISLEPRDKNMDLGLVRSLSAVNFRGSLYALASVEGEGVVLFSGPHWGGLMRERVIFENSVLPFHTALEASPDPGGRLVAAFAPMGPYATAVGVEVVWP